jgi:hypothetical protein
VVGALLAWGFISVTLSWCAPCSLRSGPSGVRTRRTFPRRRFPPGPWLASTTPSPGVRSGKTRP